MTRFKIQAEKELRVKRFTEADNSRLAEENRELMEARNLAVQQAEYYKVDKINLNLINYSSGPQNSD